MFRIKQRSKYYIKPHGLAHASRTRHKQMRGLGQVKSQDLLRYRIAQHYRQFEIVFPELGIVEQGLHRNRARPVVRNFYAYRVQQGDNPYSRNADRTGYVFFHPLDLSHFRTRGRHYFIKSDCRAFSGRNALNLYLVLRKGGGNLHVVPLEFGL